MKPSIILPLGYALFFAVCITGIIAGNIKNEIWFSTFARFIFLATSALGVISIYRRNGK